MRITVRNDLSKSAKCFKKVVWPEIESWFGEGEIEPVESVTEEGMQNRLDMLAGIDAWHIKENIGIRGLASRIQWGNPTNQDYPYNTFSVRKNRASGTPTEYKKRLRALESNEGWLYPEITIQAYLDEQEKLLSVAACQTKELIYYIRDRKKHIPCKTSSDQENNSWATFYAVSWNELKNGIDIKIYLQNNSNTPDPR